MRKIVLISLLLLGKSAFGQINENFNDDNLTVDPPWSLSSILAFVTQEGRLRSNSTILNSNFYVSTQSGLALNCSWEIKCQLKFNTSGSNYVDLYLVSDKEHLQDAVNGYFLRIGGSSDNISLYKRSGALSKIVKLTDGPEGVTNKSDNLLALKITRTSEGVFTIFSDPGTGFTEQGTVRDETYLVTSFFGIYIQQSTASFQQKHFFDDLIISKLTEDKEPPRVNAIAVKDPVKVVVIFSEPVNKHSAEALNNYILEGGPGMPVSAELIGGDKVQLTFGIPFLTGNYKLKITNVGDLNGNIVAGNTEAGFSYTAPYTTRKIKAGDILISEVLFNPAATGSDFIEIYNASSDTLNLKDLVLANADDNGQPANLKHVSANSIFIAPGAYWVLTASPEKVMLNYLTLNPDNFVAMPMPAYLVASGSVVLLSADMVIDRFNYTEDMHDPLFKNVKGVSLERVSFVTPANAMGNFVSGSAASGYATPAYENAVMPVVRDKPFEVNPVVFSPDQDGRDDQVTISYNFNEIDRMGSVNIFDDKGRLVSRLLRNGKLSAKGTLTWDGRNDQGQLAEHGIYIVILDTFDLKGNNKRYRKACVIAP